MDFRIGMRQGLLLLCTGTLVIYCVLVFVICQCFMGSYYMAEVEQELVSAYEVLCDQPDADLEVMTELEQDNLSILIFRKNSGETVYSSRYLHKDFDPMLRSIYNFLDQRLSETDEPYFMDTMQEMQRTVTGVEQYYGRTISLCGETDDCYIQISTQKEAIEKSTDIAVRFMLLVGIVVMFVATILVLLVANRIAQPVSEMTEVAGRIAEHDFTQRCEGSSITELGDLADSINTLSDQMQDYIRDLQAANARLQADLDKMEKSEQARKSLVSNISHDLKTPIALISGYADGLRAGMARTEDQMREYCDVISDETDRMMEMICQMLEVSRLESGTVQLTVDDFDLSEELDGILTSFRVEIERRGIQLTRDYPESIYIRSDALSVEQVLINYIQNAVSHMGEGNRMAVTVTGSTMLRVTVFNSAAPIPEEDLERIWDTFYRGEKSRNRASRQSGLGLAIVRGNMELLGLSYGVQNVDDGVEFWAEFPASPFETGSL
jgi:signal transduction histidine kinase